jgi:hypothetical protein
MCFLLRIRDAYFQQENAPAHTAKIFSAGCTDCFGPSHSPDLNVCNFCVSGNLKQKVCGHDSHILKASETVTWNIILEIMESEFHCVSQNLLQWCEMCFDNGGTTFSSYQFWMLGQCSGFTKNFFSVWMESLIRLCGSMWFSYARELGHQLASHSTYVVIMPERKEFMDLYLSNKSVHYLNSNKLSGSETSYIYIYIC